MKSIIIILLLTTFYANSQISIDEPAFNQTQQYCLIKATESLKGVIISIDFGQPGQKGFWGDKPQYLIDTSTNKPIEFNSVVDVLNFMNGYGWKFVDAYAITVDNAWTGKQTVYHYLMERQINAIEGSSPQGSSD